MSAQDPRLTHRNLVTTAPSHVNVLADVGDGQDIYRMVWTAFLAVIAQGIKLDDLTAPDDNTDLDATNLKHGLLSKLDKIKLNGIEEGAEATTAAKVAAVIHALATKATPVNADELGLVDSAAGNALKKVTVQDLKAAVLASAALTGTPTAPTAAGGTNTTQVATTAFVRSAIAELVASSPSALDTLNELAAALGNDPSFATTVTTALGAKVPNTLQVNGSGLASGGGALNVDRTINVPVATQAEAEAGTENAKAMTPLRTAQAIAALGGGGGGGGAIVNEYNTPGTYTWTNPSPAVPRRVLITLIGPGGGGGSGRSGASPIGGGGGGAGGALVYLEMLTTDFSATETVVVGQGGAGGSIVNTADTNGNPGSPGAINTSFGSLNAPFGLPGSGGTSSTALGGAGQSAAGWNDTFTSANTLSGSAGNTSTPSIPPASTSQPTGGGGGGGNVTGTSYPGVRGGNLSSVAGGTGGVSPGGNGGDGNIFRNAPGTGGGGGAGGTTFMSAGKGGNGVRGGGGGGGGGCYNGYASGAGGNGGDGYAKIVIF